MEVIDAATGTIVNKNNEFCAYCILTAYKQSPLYKIQNICDCSMIIGTYTQKLLKMGY